MKKEITVEYITADLERQCPEIKESCDRAIQKIVVTAIRKITGLSLSDPPELWPYAFSRIEPSVWDRPQEPTLWLTADYLLQIALRFLPGVETQEQLVAAIRKTTFKGINHSLSLTARSDAEFADWLSKLTKLYKRPPIARSEIERELEDYDKSTKILLQHWIECTRSENWIMKSLCFFSDRAMAKFVFYLARRHSAKGHSAKGRKQWLPLGRLNQEPERIRKLCSTLGLVNAQKRWIKDVSYDEGTDTVEPIPIKKYAIQSDQ